MGLVTCNTCGHVWDASINPTCPTCLMTYWLKTPDFIRPKHDPSILPSGFPMFRSVLTNDVVNNLPVFLGYVANSGTCYFNSRHNKYLYFVGDPLGVIPGSAILPNQPMPSYALDGLLIADPFGQAHAYAASQVDFRMTVLSGESIPIGKCSEPGCGNLCIPNYDKCIIHKT